MKRIEFVSDRLVQQIIDGMKTASVVSLDMVDVDEDEYNHALVVGSFYEVYDGERKPRCVIRISGMELCQWGNIPEKVWVGENNVDADEFKAHHLEYFNNPDDDYEFVAYYFHLVDSSNKSIN